jgi:hypothetical protein
MMTRANYRKRYEQAEWQNIELRRALVKIQRHCEQAATHAAIYAVAENALRPIRGSRLAKAVR